MKPDYPETRREPIVDVIHGREVADPYRWLEDEKSPEVQRWMEAQDRYARDHFEALPGRDALATRLEELSYIDSVSTPARRADRLFYWRRQGKQEKAVFLMQRDGDDRVILDPNTMSEDGSVSVHQTFPDRAGRLLAYKKTANNADAATLHLLDIDSGDELESLPAAMMAYPSWTPDGRGFYYVGLPDDDTIPPDELVGHAEIRFHAIGSDPASDPVIVPALGDPSIYIGAELSYDGRFLIVTYHRGWAATDVFFRDLQENPITGSTSPGDSGDSGDEATAVPTPEGFTALVAGREAAYSATAHDGQFYVQSNEGASRYRVFRVSPDAPARSEWREIIPERDATLQAVQIVGGHLVLSYLRKAHSEIAIHDLDGERLRTVDLPGMGSASGFLGNPDDDDAYFSYSSFVEPPQIFRASVASGETSLWRRIEFPVDTSNMMVEQVWYPSKDGTEISMFIIRRKDIVLGQGPERRGDHPVLLTGYGGFSVSMTPAFSARAALWLERGGIWAVPNLRGGGEYGEDWHRAGRGGNKQNVFDDFAAAAEYLIEKGYTRREKLAILGGSNGGLLVGATMVQRPDLMAVVVCAVPLLDMIRYHLFGRGRLWVPEYGSADDPDHFATLLAYSPYHNARDDVAYPSFLMLASDSDDRVDPMHARKFAALLQASRVSTEPVLLRIEKNAGHGGADSIRQGIERDVDMFAFLLQRLGPPSR